MTDVDTLYNKTIHYERDAYPFDELFLDVARQTLAKDGIELISLSRLHDVCSPERLGSVYSAWYGFMETDAFLQVYRSFIRTVVAPLFDAPIHYQKKPGIRAHLHGTLTVQYHTDEWYGHGSNIVNFWMPITRAFSNNSLFVASLENSVAEVQALEAAKATMDEINARLAAICTPVDLGPGDVYVFGGRVVHGTQKNDTDYTRVSLDFRILTEGGEPGSKTIDEYYESTRFAVGQPERTATAPDETPRAVTSYLLTKYGFTRQISNYQQRLMCADYARRNNLERVAEETDIKTMSHGPMLLSLANGKGTHDIEGVLLYSVMCLPEEREDRLRIYDQATRSGVTLYFANENLVLSGKSDYDLIEGRRDSLTACHCV